MRGMIIHIVVIMIHSNNTYNSSFNDSNNTKNNTHNNENRQATSEQAAEEHSSQSVGTPSEPVSSVDLQQLGCC